MGIPKLTKALKPLLKRRALASFADGTVFIDGHSMSHMIARKGKPGAMYDWRGVGISMERELSKWEAAGWKIELILFDGLTPESKFVEINARQRSRIREGGRSMNLTLAASAACVCQATIEKKFPHVNCRVSPGECDDILASIAYRYALKNPETPTYVFTADSDFAAFDFPSNVVLVNPTSIKRKYDALKLTESVQKKFKVPPSALAHEVRQLQERVRPNVMTNPVYKKFAAGRQAVLEKYNIASFADYCASDEMMHSYKVLDPHTQEPSAHRIVNSWTASKSLYMYMPILCEPTYSEYCFNAGRRWRSVAYEIIAKKAGSKERWFVEYGRRKDQAEGRNIPICDGARREHDQVPSGYKYYEGWSVTNEINKWKTKDDMIEAIIKEVVKTTPYGENYTDMHYRARTTIHLAKMYLHNIFKNASNPDRLELEVKERGKNMSTTSRRWYNKFLACVISLRLLEAAGFKLPVSLELSDMDGARWQQLVHTHFEPRFSRRKTTEQNLKVVDRLWQNKHKKEALGVRRNRARKAQREYVNEHWKEKKDERLEKKAMDEDTSKGIPTGLGPKPKKKAKHIFVAPPNTPKPYVAPPYKPYKSRVKNTPLEELTHRVGELNLD